MFTFFFQQSTVLPEYFVYKTLVSISGSFEPKPTVTFYKNYNLNQSQLSALKSQTVSLSVKILQVITMLFSQITNQSLPVGQLSRKLAYLIPVAAASRALSGHQLLLTYLLYYTNKLMKW